MISHSKRILVVDDEESSQTALQRLLELLGYEVTVASNGEEAVALFRKNSFPCVIIDFNIPGMSGLEAVKAIKQLETGGDSFIIGLTANRNASELNAGVTAGMDVVYHKPVILDIIEQTLEEIGELGLFNEWKCKNILKRDSQNRMPLQTLAKHPGVLIQSEHLFRKGFKARFIQ